MPAINRRTLVGGAAAIPFAGVVAANAKEKPMTPVAAMEPKPLPFDPAAISGLSERLLKSHHEKNYTGAVKRLGAIGARLAATDPAAEPGFVLNGLKREELIALNSAILHEVYFSGLSGKREPGKALRQQIDKDFGSIDRWRAEFAAMGKALGGGSGWVLLTFSPRASRLMNIWAADHTMTGADGTVLLALDMYEHAYALDYGADAGAYVDAFMKVAAFDHAEAAFRKAA